MMFDWHPEYGVGFAEIDGLHQQVFRAAGELHAAIAAGEIDDRLAELLARFVSCTQAHFAAEEALMQSSQYPQADRHKAAHKAFGEKLLAAEQGVRPNVETMQTFKGLVIQHIDEEDRELGRHLASSAGE
jgi:hemerythrin-like metal-binding protein